MYVMSVTQRWLGRVAANWRFKRFGAAGCFGLALVVVRKRPRLWGGVSGKDKGFLTPSFLLNFFRTAERSGRNGLSQSTIRALVAHRWKSVGGAQSWDMVKEPKLDAWNVGGALSTSGQPLLASLTGRSRRVLGLF